LDTAVSVNKMCINRTKLFPLD